MILSTICKHAWLATAIALAFTTTSLAAPKTTGEGSTIASNGFEGGTGKVILKSWNASMAALMTGALPASDIPVDAVLTLPKHATGRVPAGILLHGITGISDQYTEAAAMLNEMGMAALVIDSYATRGVKSIPEARAKSPLSYRVGDAYAGLKLLSAHPAIDPNRIVLMGYSAGGAVTLLSMSNRVRQATVGDGGPRFAAYVGYYPDCAFQYRHPDAPGVPVLMQLGELDNIAPPQICRDYAKRLEAKGVDIKVVTYPGAYHLFDSANVSGKVVEFPGFTNNGKCMERILQIEERGTWYATWLDRSATTPAEFGKLFEGCAFGVGNFGGPVEARTQSDIELHEFLKRAVGIR